MNEHLSIATEEAACGTLPAVRRRSHELRRFEKQKLGTVPSDLGILAH